tara:strand:- start:354 stop:764 length:411 start_codon:yes stop_codon:yes gene_type:complete
MCELLIRVEDKTNSDPVLDRQSSKAGDIITVQEDGWAWGTKELDATHWMIVKLPGVAVSAYADMLQSETVEGQDGKQTLIRRRRKGIDVSHPTFVSMLADDRAAKAANAPAPRVAGAVPFAAMKRSKAPVGVVVIG